MAAVGDKSGGSSGAGVPAMARRALDEVGMVFAALPPEAPDQLCDAVLAARRIACYGVGREGLMVRALCMRLMHLGFDAHVVGDVTTPPVGPGDLLLVSAGPGAFSTVLALLTVAREAGATTLVVTAQPGGEAARAADVVVHLPAQTMADDRGGVGRTSLLPMGSLFEAAQLLFFDLVSIVLRERTGQTPDEMRARHTNLE
jgi:6-phospho-3-hexuloisomerase